MLSRIFHSNQPKPLLRKTVSFIQILNVVLLQVSKVAYAIFLVKGYSRGRPAGELVILLHHYF